MNGTNMKQKKWAVLALALVGAPVLAAPADLVRSRVEGYKELGAAFKAANDAIRSGSPTPAVLRKSAAAIVAASKRQYQWFPIGSRPQSGVKTHAKQEIWSDSKTFRDRQDAFARQAAAFQKAASSGDVSVLRSEARKLGASCKACHDQFRVEDD